jgi:hypothetical protein
VLIDLNGDQVRQMINTEQAFEALRAAQAERARRFAGSMAWKRVGGRDYLYRKTNGVWKSLGPRSPEAEQAMEAFKSGRAGAKARIAALDETLRGMAPVNRAMRLGRVPWTAARLLRKLDGGNLLGKGLSVAGTYALFAYERMAAAHFEASHIATNDIDLLYDARRSLRLIGPAGQDEGLKGLLDAVDSSFQLLIPGGYRAVNEQGFMVDLITPLPLNPGISAAARIGEGEAAMAAAEIAGLDWLRDCPQVQQIAIDERGYPVPLSAPDPRAFALHKLWVSQRPDRDPGKARRDIAQARAVAGLVSRYLPHLRIDDPALAALPAALRDRWSELAARPVQEENW